MPVGNGSHHCYKNLKEENTPGSARVGPEDDPSWTDPMITDHEMELTMNRTISTATDGWAINTGRTRGAELQLWLVKISKGP